MKRIYADFNDIGNDGALLLTARGSRLSIAQLQEPLKNGERVRFSDGDIACFGSVHLRDDGTWEGRSDWNFVSEADSKAPR